MNPNLVDSKLFDYDLKQLDKITFRHNSFVLNMSMFIFLMAVIFCIFYVCKSNITKNERNKHVKNKLVYILDRSSGMIQ